jgi:hypothetical protein
MGYFVEGKIDIRQKQKLLPTSAGGEITLALAKLLCKISVRCTPASDSLRQAVSLEQRIQQALVSDG